MLCDLGDILVKQIVLPDVTHLERLLIAEALRFPDPGKMFQRIAIEGTLEMLRPRIERVIAIGEMRPCDPLVALVHFANIAVSALHRRVLFNDVHLPSDVELKNHLLDVVEIFLHGYAR